MPLYVRVGAGSSLFLGHLATRACHIDEPSIDDDRGKVVK